MRLFEAARAAKEGGFDAFTSSLFISPYQKHELMRDVAYRAAEENGVTFYYQDFRPMFRDGRPVRGNWAFICRNTAAVSSLSRSATKSPAGSSRECFDFTVINGETETAYDQYSALNQHLLAL